MKVYMVVRSNRPNETLAGQLSDRIRDTWTDNYVYLQEEDAIARVEELNKGHQRYCERYHNSLEYLEFYHILLELRGSWIDV